ncbi:hypothetical protein LX66_3560 [Chitinophaga japonensis]|uniref:Uncharacterized protein n=1 Tax=Chitinophaga japonensis TaxID=104662 RepID=A0A562SZQ0_CHIJA|nr:hypothetical protein LX66_3560 [Chitinophaga japonensis]
MVVDNKYEIGDRVYLVSDPDQQLRIITSFAVYKGGEILYTVACGEKESRHYDFEMSKDKDLNITTNG